MGKEYTSNELRQKAMEHVYRHGRTRKEIIDSGAQMIKSGSGVWIEDVDGNRYLDAIGGGSAAATLGHGRQDIAKVCYDQMCELQWYSLRNFYNKPSALLATEITEELMHNDLAMCFFVSSGSEAVETASQMTKMYQQKKGFKEKTKFLYRTGGYHGTSMIGASASSDKKTKEAFYPLAPGFVEVPGCNCYHCPFGKDPKSCRLECANAIEETILREGPDTVAALFAEVIPAGQVEIPHEGYLERLREICSKYGVLWIDDEVFICFGRTGKWFAYQHYNVVPDIITVSKGITAGYIPLAAAIASKEIINTLFQDGDKNEGYVAGHTYAAHPAASAVGLKCIDIVRDERLLDNVIDTSATIESRLNEMKEEFPCIGDIRVKGFLIGIEMVKDRTTGEKLPKELNFGKKIVAHAMYKKKLMIRANGDTIILSPALVFTQEDAITALNLFHETLVGVCEELGL